MNQPDMTGPDYVRAVDGCLNEASNQETGTVARLEIYTEALVYATMARTAAAIMAAETHGDYLPYEIEAWRDVIPQPPLKECKGQDTRRPECADRHTEDCDYADPIPEPPHKLLPVGTRVLVSPRATKYSDGRVVYDKQPKVAKIDGYDLSRSKYQLKDEKPGGGYYDFVTWAFADNRVQRHPEQDGAVAEPTGPRMYVQGGSGVQGYIIGTGTDPDRGPRIKVHWLEPGGPETWVGPTSVGIITDDEVARCENGQDGEECGSGENQCELCLAAEDAEAEAIEGSMNV